MINAPPPPAADAETLDRIVARGPIGSATVAGIATLLVIGMWIAFYLLIFVPRSSP